VNKLETTRLKKTELSRETRRGRGRARTVTYLPQRPGGARGPGEGAGEGGEAHRGDDAEGMGRKGGRALGFGLRSSGDRVGGQ